MKKRQTTIGLECHAFMRPTHFPSFIYGYPSNP